MPVPASADSALRVTDLRKSYGGREVVRGLSFEAAAGRLTAVLGPNGAGKTTTVECCEGLRRPDAGTIEVLGQPVCGDGAPAQGGYGPVLRARVGVMLQDGGLPLAPRAGNVLAHLARLHDDPHDPAALMSRLGLSDVARTSVRRLSGGQRQRLALAGAVVGRPDLVFLDEPSAGLDPHARLAVWELLRELRSGGVSLVLTTHLMSEAEELADHVVIIDAGGVVAQGAPGELTGPDEVRVTPPSGTPAEAVAGVLRSRLGAELSVRAHDDHVAVSLPGDPDAATLARVTTALDDAGYGAAAVGSHRRTLEDVFLDLTGRTLRTADATAENAS